MAQNSDKSGWGSNHNHTSNGGHFKHEMRYGCNNPDELSQFSSLFGVQSPNSNNNVNGGNVEMSSRSSIPPSGIKDSSLVQNSYLGWSGNNGSNPKKNWNIPSGGQNSSGSSTGTKFMGDTSDPSYEGLIGATGGSDSPPASRGDSQSHSISSSGWSMMPPPRMGLLGGGETSLNNNSNSWGTPPPSCSTANGWNGVTNINNNQWGNAGRQNSGNSVDTSNNCNQGLSSPKHNTWAQAAGKGLNSNGPNPSNGNAVPLTEPPNPSSSKSKQDDHISEIKMAAAFSDGWGQLNINQDSGWDIPPSPQASPKENNSSMWRAPANTGTEIWENNVRQRNKGNGVSSNSNSGISASGASQPWGHHTPSTHIGGTWGEEEDTSNMWTGVPPAGNNISGGGGGGGAGGMGGHGNIGGNSGSNNNHNSGWGNSGNDSGSNPNMWGGGNVRDNPPRDGGDRNQHGNEPNKHWSGSGSSSSWCEPDPVADNGTSVWSVAPPKPAQNMNSWGGGSSSGSNVPKPNVKEGPPSGWEEPSPPMPRRPVPNYDDGTSLWGNPTRQGGVMLQGSGGGSMSNQGMPQTGPGMIRLPSNPGGKMDLGPWGKAPRTNWTDLPPHRDSPGPGNWDEPPNQMKSMPGTPGTPGSWGEPASPYWGAKPKNPNSNWSEGQIDTSTWSGPSKQPLSKELIWASKQFRILTETGFKKDDVENVLRMANMNFEEALVELQSMSARESGLIDVDGFNSRPKVRPSSLSDELSLVDHGIDSSFGAPGTFHGGPGFQGINAGFGNMQGFKPLKGSGFSSNTPPSLLSNPAISGQGSSLNLGNSINSLTPAMVQKILHQHQQQTAQNAAQTFTAAQQNLNNNLGNQAGRVNQQNFPTAAQLRHLVQQIQMAVQAGHLNPQILNQPLAPQTLMLLYQLLQQIKVLHQLQQQQLFQSQHLSKGGGGGSGPPGNPSPLQVNVQITQTKQRIVNFQNQIAAQQALFLKQQVGEPIHHQMPHQANQHMPLHTAQNSSADLFKPNLESIQGLQHEFRDISLKDSVPTSRLSQWKMPSMDKDDVPQNNNPISGNSSSAPGHNNTMNTSTSSANNSGGANNSGAEFSRAPGPISKSGSNVSSNTAAGPNNLHPLLTQGDSTWSSVPRSQGDGWPDHQSGNNGSSNERNAAPPSGNIGNSNSGSNNQGSTNNSNAGNSGGETKDNIVTSSSGGTSGTVTGNMLNNSSQQPAYNISDLVPEFEPGKPWKGNSQIKNVEDDPHITPGSITQSPFSLNTIKDTELFNWSTSKSNATSTSGDSLASSLASLTSSSTWAFTPPPSTSLQSSQTATGNKPGNGKSNWGPMGNDTLQSSDLWGSNVMKPRGPPPGLSAQNKNLSGSSSWNSSGHGGTGGSTTSGSGRHNNWGTQEARPGVSPGWDRQNSSSFLILRNLTPQIDGSTLRTLCMQHGPLQLFQLFLNHGHGIALVRYQTREEAAKAQAALNNCVLGNTTIMVDIPTESEIANLQMASGGGQHSNQGGPTTTGWPNAQSQSAASTGGNSGQSTTPGFRGTNPSNTAFPFGSGATAGQTSSGPVGKMDSNTWNSSGSALNLPGSHLWSFPGSSSTSLWGTTSGGDQDQNSQGSLNSYLPEDLLGGESI